MTTQLRLRRGSFTENWLPVIRLCVTVARPTRVSALRPTSRLYSLTTAPERSALASMPPKTVRPRPDCVVAAVDSQTGAGCRVVAGADPART